jgi:hypothetical protein
MKSKIKMLTLISMSLFCGAVSASNEVLDVISKEDRDLYGNAYYQGTMSSVKLADAHIISDLMVDMLMTNKGLTVEEPLKKLLFTAAYEYSYKCEKKYSLALLENLTKTKIFETAIAEFEANNSLNKQMAVSKAVMENFDCDTEKWNDGLLNKIRTAIKKS